MRWHVGAMGTRVCRVEITFDFCAIKIVVIVPVHTQPLAGAKRNHGEGQRCFRRGKAKKVAQRDLLAVTVGLESAGGAVVEPAAIPAALDTACDQIHAIRRRVR